MITFGCQISNKSNQDEIKKLLENPEAIRCDVDSDCSQFPVIIVDAHKPLTKIITQN